MTSNSPSDPPSNSSVPPTSGSPKRHHPSARGCSRSRSRSLSPGAQEAPPQKRIKTSPKRNRPKLSDLPRIPRTIVELAIQDYCSKLATECPFPNSAQEQEMAAAALLRACESLGLSIEDEATYDNALALVQSILILLYFVSLDTR